MTELTWRQMLLYYRAAERQAQRRAQLDVAHIIGGAHAK